MYRKRGGQPFLSWPSTKLRSNTIKGKGLPRKCEKKKTQQIKIRQNWSIWFLMTQVASSLVRRKHAWNKVLEFILVITKIFLAAVKIIYCKMYERYQTAGREASSQGDNLWINFENVFKPVAFCWKFSSQLPFVENFQISCLLLNWMRKKVL